MGRGPPPREAEAELRLRPGGNTPDKPQTVFAVVMLSSSTPCSRADHLHSHASPYLAAAEATISIH